MLPLHKACNKQVLSQNTLGMHWSRSRYTSLGSRIIYSVDMYKLDVSCFCSWIGGPGYPNPKRGCAKTAFSEAPNLSRERLGVEVGPAAASAAEGRRRPQAFRDGNYWLFFLFYISFYFMFWFILSFCLMFISFIIVILFYFVSSVVFFLTTDLSCYNFDVYGRIFV